MAKNGLKFVGGRQVLPGAPMRDLSHEEVNIYGGYDLLLSSGLYEEVKPVKPRKKQKSEVDNGNDNNGR